MGGLPYEGTESHVRSLYGMWGGGPPHTIHSGSQIRALQPTVRPATFHLMHRHGLVRWCEDGLKTVEGVWLRPLDTVAFTPFPDSLLSSSVAFSQDPRSFITRLNDRPYLWCRRRLAMKSKKH